MSHQMLNALSMEQWPINQHKHEHNEFTGDQSNSTGSRKNNNIVRCSREKTKNNKIVRNVVEKIYDYMYVRYLLN